ncbi:hypothetical protein GN956_G8474 [Arapaima gigas]
MQHRTWGTVSFLQKPPRVCRILKSSQLFQPRGRRYLNTRSRGSGHIWVHNVLSLFARRWDSRHRELSMETSSNDTSAAHFHPPGGSGGHEYLYVVMVMSFYGVFLLALGLGYARSKRREKRQSNVFARLLREEERRAWGSVHDKHSPSLSVNVPAAAGMRSVRAPPFHEGRVLAPLVCALCAAEQSSVSSLSSAADTRCVIEEESDGASDLSHVP